MPQPCDRVPQPALEGEVCCGKGRSAPGPRPVTLRSRRRRARGGGAAGEEG